MNHALYKAATLFAIGAVCHAYTGTQIVKEYENGTLVKKTSNFSYERGTGLGWAAFIIILVC